MNHRVEKLDSTLEAWNRCLDLRLDYIARVYERRAGDLIQDQRVIEHPDFKSYRTRFEQLVKYARQTEQE